MRIWTVHPSYLDAKGLVALWRETLLALHVLQGRTRGYRNHPQLIRFRAQPDPVAAVGGYLEAVHDEAVGRGYRFDRSKLPESRASAPLSEAEGQLRYEWEHLMRKLRVRDPERAERFAAVDLPEPHPLFRIVPGPVAGWERV